MSAQSARSSPSRRDLYADVTQQIVAAIETGAASFTLPWHTVCRRPRNIVSTRGYRGINTLLLWLAGQAKAYPTADWATFKQWREIGHPVRAGEQAATVIFWKQWSGPAGQSDAGDVPAQDGRRPFVARAYHVFNAAQVHDYAPPPATPLLPETERDTAAERFFRRLPLNVEHGESQAYYLPDADRIHLPDFARFKDANSYYSVRGHESVHATGAKHRLDRNLAGRFGSNAYEVEELIAELGASFLCADLQLSPTPRPDHAGYLAAWLKVLNADTRAIFTVAGQAQAAVDWLHAQQPVDQQPGDQNHG
jgi:antirestriction protein ArdC